MSIFRIGDYKQDRSTVYSKKTRLPTSTKTKKHRCSHCQRNDAKRVSISEKEVRWLCVICIKIRENKNTKEKPNFVKATNLLPFCTNNCGNRTDTGDKCRVCNPILN